MANHFQLRKNKILLQLDAPESEYHDLSPKGSLDEPIRSLIRDINGYNGIVTTSSCSGRMSVFLEGRKTDNDSTTFDANSMEPRTGTGGKGGGGTWLFVSHTPLNLSPTAPSPDYMTMFGFEKGHDGMKTQSDTYQRYIHFKFEPMILHILSASLEHAQRILTAALTAGFRESGAMSLVGQKIDGANPMVAVRSSGYAFDSIVGYHDAKGCNIPLVDENYLRTLVSIANQRFVINTERIGRFHQALVETCGHQIKPRINSKPDWEDAGTRKLRKRVEGLARQQEMRHGNASRTNTRAEETEFDVVGEGLFA